MMQTTAPQASPSKVILGLWPMAGVTSVTADDQESIRTIRTAIDHGITWLDTAYAYGYEGRSDAVLRQAIAGIESQVSVIGKVGQRWNAQHQRVVDGSPETLTRDAEESLGRCGLTRFRWLLLHQPDPQVPVEESAQALLRLQQRGLTESIGICNATVDQLARFQSVAPVVATQFGFNLLQAEPSAAIRPWCAEHACYGLAYWVLMKGLLAGAITRDHVFPPGDSRPNYPIFQGEARERAHRTVDRLKIIAADLQTNVAALVIAWTVRQRGVSAAIVGALRPHQIIESAHALTLSLSDAQLSEIASS